MPDNEDATEALTMVHKLKETHGAAIVVCSKGDYDLFWRVLKTKHPAAYEELKLFKIEYSMMVVT